MRRCHLYLNLDAEEELAEVAAGSTARPRARSGATLRALARGAEALAAVLPSHLVPLAPAAHAREPERAPRPAAGPAPPALAWCPTPRARSELAALGFTPTQSLALALGRPPGEGAPRGLPASFEDEACPTPEALAAANDRATFALASPLPDGAVARTLAAATAHLAGDARGRAWLLRRAHSAAGRGARRVTGGGPLPPGDAAWLAASLRRGAVTLDPVVELARELAQHGWLTRTGEVMLGAPCAQTVSPQGTWRATRRLGVTESEPGLVAALERAARRVAADLMTLGYCGPFGIDAYEWRDERGALRLRAPSEVNARFSMGWWVGFADAIAPTGPATCP